MTEFQQFPGASVMYYQGVPIQVMPGATVNNLNAVKASVDHMGQGGRQQFIDAGKSIVLADTPSQALNAESGLNSTLVGTEVNGIVPNTGNPSIDNWTFVFQKSQEIQSLPNNQWTVTPNSTSTNTDVYSTSVHEANGHQLDAIIGNRLGTDAFSNTSEFSTAVGKDGGLGGYKDYAELFADCACVLLGGNPNPHHNYAGTPPFPGGWSDPRNRAYWKLTHLEAYLSAYKALQDLPWTLKVLYGLQNIPGLLLDISQVILDTFLAVRPVYGSPKFSIFSKPQDNNTKSKPLDKTREGVKSARSRPAQHGDPLLLDLNGDGIHTTSQANAIYFDHDRNGFAEQSNWVSYSPDGGDGVLAWDRNGDDVINDGNEIFGNNMGLSSGQAASDGFAALSELDTNSDGIINSSDLNFSELRILRADGALLTIAEANISALNVQSIETNSPDGNGNIQLRVGSYTKVDGTVGLMADYDLAIDTSISIAIDSLPISEEIAGLPYINGFGNVFDLHQAMVRDMSGDLQALVESFINENDSSIREDILDEILIKWTNSDGPDLHSTPHGEDGRFYSVLEKFMGIESINPGTGFIGYNQVADLNEAYFWLKEYVNAQLMAQTQLSDLLNLMIPSQDEDTGEIHLDFSEIASKLEQEINDDSDLGRRRLSDFVRAAKGLSMVDNSNFDEFYDQLSTLGLQYQTVMDTAGEYVLQVAGTSGNDLVSGSNIDQRLDGFAGNDTLEGFAGRDHMVGGTGNDRLIGGGGNDILFGQQGNDTYVFNSGDGHDYIYEQIPDSTGTVITNPGNDVIEFGPGIEANDLIFSADRDNLLIKIAGTDDQIDVMGQLGSDPNMKVEKIVFADQTEITAEQILSMLSTSGTEAADTINGSDYSETIYGNGGNDTIRSFAGNDVIDGGEGADSIYAGSGNSTIEGGDGADHLYTGTGVANFVFNEGDGQDVIHEDTVTTAKAQSDKVTFGEGITQDDVIFTPDDKDIIVGLRGTSDSITLLGALDPLSKNNVGQFDFADQSTLTLPNVIANKLEVDLAGSGVVYRTPENGVIQNIKVVGTDGDDIIQTGDATSLTEAGEGNDVVVGGSGNDTIVFNLGDGEDIVIPGAGTNKVVFGAGIEVEDVIFEAEGADLVARIDGTSDRITIKGQFEDNSAAQIGSFEFDDETIVTWADIKDDVIIYASTSGATVDRSSSSTDEVVAGLGGAETITGGSGTNVIIGGAGNDVVTGGSGANTYLFRRGDGDDVINEDASVYTGDDVDVLRFGSGITLNNVSFTADGNDLLVEIEDSSDSVRLAGALDSNADRRVEFVEFADGTKVSMAQILNEETDPEGEYVTVNADPEEALIYTADSGVNEYVRGSEFNDNITLDEGGGVVEAGAGNDIIHAGAGSSFINAGSGNDSIYAGTGRSIFAFDRNSGSDIIYYPVDKDGASQDTVSFGEDIEQNDILLESDGIDLTVKIDGSSAQLLLDGALDMEVGAGERVENFAFADGTTLSFKELVERGIVVDNSQNNATIDRRFSTFDETISLSGNNDTLRLGSGDVEVDTGSGNHRVHTGHGNGTIYFNLDSGSIDLNTSQAKLPGAIDRVVFGPGIAKEDLVITYVAHDLLISIPNTSARLKLVGALQGSQLSVSEFVFDDETVMTFEEFTEQEFLFTNASSPVFNHSTSTVNEIIQSTANDNILLGAGNDIVLLESGNHLVQAQNSNGNKTIIINGDDAELVLGPGTDTIVVNRGANTVIIDESFAASENNQDKLKFGDGITVDEVVASAVNGSHDVTLSVNDTDVEVVLEDAMQPGAKRIAEVEFSDGDSMTLDELFQLGVNVDATALSVNRSFSQADENIALGGNNNTLTTGSGDNVITVGAGNHTINTGTGSSNIIGGEGNSTINTGSGSDTITINRGTGSFVVNEGANNASGKHDEVVFGEDIELEDLVFSSTSSSDDLIVSINGSSFTATLDHALNPGSSDIEKFSFVDNETELTLEEIWEQGISVNAAGVSNNRSFSQANETISLTGDTLNTGSGNNVISVDASGHTINTGTGSNIINGGQGTTVINRGSGSDTIVVSRGTGSFEIKETVENASGKTDIVKFASDIDTDDVYIQHMGNDIKVEIKDSNFSTLVRTQFGADPDRVDGFEFEGGPTWTVDDLINRGFDVRLFGGTADRTNTGDKEIVWGSGSNDLILLGSHANTVTSGAGNDTIFSNADQDTFVLALGDGNDTINEDIANAAGKKDYVKFAAGIDEADVALFMNGTTLEIGFVGGTSSRHITINMGAGNHAIDIDRSSNNVIVGHVFGGRTETCGTRRSVA